MQTIRFLSATGLLFAGGLLAGCGKKNAAAGPAMMMGTPEVSVITIEPRRIELTTELSGRVAASLTAEVRPQVSGILQKRLFNEGADVKEGDLLYQIDPAVYQAAFDGAKAALAKAEANLAPVKLKAERYEELKKSEAVSVQDYDEAVAALKLTEAEIESAKAALESARINLAYTKVTAPISGRIGRSAVTNGALVTANQAAPLATIVKLDPVYVDVTQSSADMLRLRKALESGQLSGAKQADVTLTLDDQSRYPETGTLKFSEAFVDEATGTVTLRTQFPNPKLILLPGMFVRARLVDGVRENAILVPQRGVSRNPAGDATVMAVNEKNLVEMKIIKADRTVGNEWLVSEGLKPGDKVILEGLQTVQRLPPGTPVKTVPFQEKTLGH
jgi:membrane fusion protein (multidrug efflux system)